MLLFSPNCAMIESGDFVQGVFILKFKRILCGLLSSLVILGSGLSVSAESPDTRVEEILGSMTLHEKICQMMFMYQVQMPDVLAGSGTVGPYETGEKLRASLEAYPVGGILYDAGNMGSRDQFIELTDKGQEYSKYPMFAAVDEEGGRVARVGKTLGYVIGGVSTLNPMLSYEDQGPDVAKLNASIIGQNMEYYGLNLDFAPVADVHSNPANPIINDRAYSTTFEGAAGLIPSAVRGFHEAGVACTLKHFPGHGDTSSDTHKGTVFVEKSMDDIRAHELQPFRAGIAEGADMVMAAHITVREIGEPSLFSYDILTNLLRNECGFDGVIVSDGLNMQAITDNYTIGEVCEGAINAGCDMFCCFGDVEEAVSHIEECIINGRLTESRIDESVRRIIRCKLNRGIMT